ncbi:MAG: glycosyltransferase family 2 protein [Acidobacteriota bacterium]
MTTVAAVVVRWKGGEEVERCLRSLMDNGPPSLTEIVLVDAGSGDGGGQRLAQAFPEIQVDLLPENPGFAGAANHGVKATTAEYIFLLNPDTEVHPQALKMLVASLEKRPDLAGVVPLLENTDGSSQHRWQLKDFPTRKDLGLGRSGKPAFKHRPEHQATVAQPAAAAWLIRRTVWDALGGLDQAFFPAWWEDVDFCLRLCEMVKDPACALNETWRVVPQARVRHAGGSSVESLGDQAFLEAFYGNLLRFAERHDPQHLPAIRRRLRRGLMARALLKPSRFRAYRGVLRGLDTGREGRVGNSKLET